MAEKKTVLIVEDSPAQALALGHSLEQAGLRVLWARDGHMGVSMAQEVHPQGRFFGGGASRDAAPARHSGSA
jgi:CheY-like chemotaxis protein